MASFWKKLGKAALIGFSGPSGILKFLSIALFSWIGKGINKVGHGIRDAVSSVANSSPVNNWIKGTTGSGLTNSEIQQNDWNAQQAQEQRAWEEHMDNTKYQRQVADMAAAGLNPAMMMGQGYSASAPSGAAASGGDAGTPSGGLLDSILSVIFAKQRMSNLRAEGEVLKSQANKNNAEADESRTNVSYKQLLIDYYPKLSEATIDKIGAEIEKLGASSDLDRSSSSLNDAQRNLTDIRASIAELEKEWLPKIKSAETNELKARAAQEFANAAWENYMKSYSQQHGGVIPGRDQWTGFATTLADCIMGSFASAKDWISSIIPEKWKK